MHVMIDCESMGVVPGCAIISIGAVVFDPLSGETNLGTFFRNVDLLSCVLAGLHVDPETQKWWREEAGEDARKALYREPAVPLEQALDELSFWIRSQGPAGIWANGPLADVAWLEAAYRAVGQKVPWTHREPRCYRTIVDLAGLGRNERAKPKVAHDALADAEAQVEDVIACYRRLGK